MYYILSLLAGAIISGMILINGELTGYFGVYGATATIHGVGLVAVLLMQWRKKEPLRPRTRLAWPYYLGGFIGVGTTLFNNMAVGKISVSAILGLGFLGQSICALTIDHYGLFHSQKRRFYPQKLLGLGFILLGIVVFSMDNTSGGAWMAFVVSLLSGITIVMSRVLNAVLAKETGPIASSVYNFVFGFVLTLCIFGFVWLGGERAPWKGFPPIWAFGGGIMGFVVVTLFNVVSHKISNLYVAVISFVGQVFTGLILDYLFFSSFSYRIFLGALAVTAGFIVNLLADRRQKPKAAEAEAETGQGNG